MNNDWSGIDGENAYEYKTWDEYLEYVEQKRKEHEGKDVRFIVGLAHGKEGDVITEGAWNAMLDEIVRLREAIRGK